MAHWLSVFNIVIFYFDKHWYDSLNYNLQILQTHKEVRNTVLPKILYIFYRGNLKNQINFIKIKYHDIKYRKINPLFSFVSGNSLVVVRRLILVFFCRHDSSVDSTYLQYIIILEAGRWPICFQVIMFNVYFLMRLGQLLLTTRLTE